MIETKSSNLELIPEYLQNNLEILSYLKGSKIVNMWRLASVPDDDLLLTYEPILIESDRIGRILIFNDEGMNNIVIINDRNGTNAIDNLIRNSLTLSEIVSESNSEILNNYDFGCQIDDINILTCGHEFLGWNLMSGIELIFSDGKKLAIGTEITELEIQGLWIIDPVEIDSKWKRISLEECDSYYDLNFQAEKMNLVT